LNVVDMLAMAEQVRAAYVGADLSAFAALLADDARWGGDDHPNRCRSRDDVLRTFSGWITSGVTADVVGIDIGPSGISCRIHVNWIDPSDRARGVDLFHVFLVRDGLIVEIRRYDDAKSAAKAIGSG
jgi:hypothetical protein